MNLTFNEALYLADIISIHAGPPPGVWLGTDRPPYPEMILKLADVVDSVEVDGELPVAFSYGEFMLVWEHIKSSVVIGTERVGLNLRLKTARELMRIIEEENKPEPVLEILEETRWGRSWSYDNADPNTSGTPSGPEGGAEPPVSA